MYSSDTCPWECYMCHNKPVKQWFSTCGSGPPKGSWNRSFLVVENEIKWHCVTAEWETESSFQWCQHFNDIAHWGTEVKNSVYYRLYTLSIYCFIHVKRTSYLSKGPWTPTWLFQRGVSKCLTTTALQHPMERLKACENGIPVGFKSRATLHV